MKHISGEKGAVGGVTEYTFTDNGQESVITETIKSVQPGEHITMDFVMDGVMVMDYKMEFDRKGNKTHIKSSTTTTGEGMFMRSMVSFMTGAMQSQEDENMAKLKRLIEENTTNYFPETITESVD